MFTALIIIFLVFVVFPFVCLLAFFLLLGVIAYQLHKYYDDPDLE